MLSPQNNGSLRVVGTQTVLGVEIPIAVGGFSPNSRCLCDKTVAVLHGIAPRSVRARITDNIDRFQENMDYIDFAKSARKPDTLAVLYALGYTRQSVSQATHIFLLSESGYVKLSKTMISDKSLKVSERLLDEYFSASKSEKNAENVGNMPDSKEIQLFTNEKFGQLRVMVIDGEPWMVGRDVAAALGYNDTSDALKRHVDPKDKCLLKAGGSPTFKVSNYGAYFINESGLYALVFSSKLPDAKNFRRWVTSEVLPSIRKHGGYIAGQECMSNEELLARAVLLADSKMKEQRQIIARQAAKIEEDRPKVAFAEAVAESSECISIGDFAKIIAGSFNINLGRNQMFAWLKAEKILQPNNLPYQQYLSQNYFRVAEQVGNGRLYWQTLITGAGQLFLYKKLQETFNKQCTLF